MTTKQVIIIRKDLKMPTGKAISQGAHASLGAVLSCSKEPRVGDRKEINISLTDDDDHLTSLGKWLNGDFTKAVLAVHSEEELLMLEAVAKETWLPYCLIKDNGTTVFNGVKTYTALAIGPADIEDIDRLTGHLKLY